MHKNVWDLFQASKQGYHKLQSCVSRENFFIKDKFSSKEDESEEYPLLLDVPSQLLAAKWKSLNLQPVQTGVNGNSLFSAVSVAVAFHDKYATELRVRCCLEMVSYASFYQWQQDYDLLCRYAPDYVDSCLNCATPSGDSCIFTISALASVIGRSLESLYPSVEGQNAENAAVLTRVFMPREELRMEESVKILWSGNSKSQPRSWIPEYFVPLITTGLTKVSISAGESSYKLEQNKRKIKEESNSTLGTSADVTIKTANDDCGDEESVSEISMGQVCNKRRRMIIDFDWQRKYTCDAVGGKPLEGAMFLTVNEIFKEITTYESVLPSIPKGRKEDVFFIIDNSKNIRFPGRRKTFPDDCGMYSPNDTATCKSWFQIREDGTLESVNKVRDKFCREKRSVCGRKSVSQKLGGRSWLPLEPQPKEEELVLLHRYYSVLLCDPSYRRRISWFISLPLSVTKGREVFLVEYLRRPQILQNQQRVRSVRKKVTKQNSDFIDFDEAIP